MKGPTYQELLDSDTREVPSSYRWNSPSQLGNTGIPIERYLDRKWHELEKAKLWSRTWQMACREDQLADVGSTVVYDIVDQSYLIVRAHDGPGGLLGFPNACLHKGRTLRDGPGRVEELQCPFHGFCWSLDGKLKRVPSAWDFPHVKPNDFQLPRVQVDTWGGFVFINPDPGCESLQSYLGELPALFERYPLENRYTRAHVSKEIRANWKLVQEAFMEAYHVVTTHPQILPGFGDANSQYDVSGNFVRGISSRGMPSPLLAWSPTEQEILDSQIDRREGDPAYVMVPEGMTARSVMAEGARFLLRSMVGDAVDQLSDAEMVDACYYNVFPNLEPWGAYNLITYRFRPCGDRHDSTIMDVWFLAPYAGEKPEAAQEIHLGPDDNFRDVADVLGELARVFDQDEFNLEAVWKGLHTTRRKELTLGEYQESTIRHWHHLYEELLERP